MQLTTTTFWRANPNSVPHGFGHWKTSQPAFDEILRLLVGTKEGGGLVYLTKKGGSDKDTCYGVLRSIDPLCKLISDPDFYNNDSSTFQSLKSFTVFFPIRQKLPNFVKMCMGFVDDSERNRLVKFQQWKTFMTEEKQLTSEGHKVVRSYTSERKWWCTRINLLLAADMLDSAHPEYSIFVKQLKCCIGWQTPKFKGYVYRGALHSPLEIFVFAFKRRFYIPSFTSSSVYPERCFYTPWKEGISKGKYNHQNVKFEINTSEFPDFTTLIQKEQTEHKSEMECLISCYNIFEWSGYRYENGVPIVTLKILDYNKFNDTKNNKIINGTTTDLPTEWMTKRGDVPRSREMTPTQFNYNLKELFQSYQSAHGKMAWLNADFGGS